jgi:hypothetical protein
MYERHTERERETAHHARTHTHTHTHTQHTHTQTLQIDPTRQRIKYNRAGNAYIAPAVGHLPVSFFFSPCVYITWQYWWFCGCRILIRLRSLFTPPFFSLFRFYISLRSLLSSCIRNTVSLSLPPACTSLHRLRLAGDGRCALCALCRVA